MRFLSSVLTLASCLVISTIAKADSVPPAFAIQEIDLPTQFAEVFSLSFGTLPDSDGLGSFGQTTAFNSQSPSGSASLTTTGRSGFSFSSLFYDFEVEGPVGTEVNLNLSAVGNSMTNSSVGIASGAVLSVFSPDLATTYFQSPACAGDLAVEVQNFDGFCNGAPTAFDLGVVLRVNANQLYTINLLDAVFGTGTGVASIDPTLSLTAGESADYTLLLSPNLVATPEPSTLALLGTGALGIFRFVRRRK
jgi:hypothetical protein